jgi:hypothetical protein
MHCPTARHAVQHDGLLYRKAAWAGGGIYNGDVLITDASAPPAKGRVCVAMVHGDVILATLAYRASRRWLESSTAGTSRQSMLPPEPPPASTRSHALFLKLGACLPSSIVPDIVNSNIKSWADAQRQPAPRARWLSSFGRRCGRSGNQTGQATTASCAPLFEEGDENDCR